MTSLLDDLRIIGGESKDVEATRALDAFLDTRTFEPPRWDKFRFVFAPKDAAG
jgi:hypothetical protein